MGAKLAFQSDVESLLLVEDVKEGQSKSIGSKSETTRSHQKRHTLNRASVRRNTTRSSVGNPSIGLSLASVESIGLLSPRSRRTLNRTSQDVNCRSLDTEVSSAHRVVVIGDLHGMLHKVKSLWQSLEMTLGESALLSALVVFLGDYVDRGPHTKDLLTWLRTLQRQRACKGARTVFLCGNHEFCLLGFLGLLPKPVDNPDFSFSDTWTTFSKSNGRSLDKSRLWGADEPRDVLDCVHIQGRRWGGSWYEKSYGSHATFAAYGVAMGDREGLLRAMPQDHLDFLAECPWVHIEENPLLGRLVFVHAGLETNGTTDCEAELTQLRHRDARNPQPETLFGRDAVLSAPPLLAQRGTTVISGHHGRVLFKRHRIILDSCCGDEHNPLTALILPEMLLVQNDGTIDQKNYSSVFGSHWKTAHVEMVSKEASQRSSKSPSAYAAAEKTRTKSFTQADNGRQRSPEKVEFTLPSTLAGLTRVSSKERQRPPGDSSPLE